MHQLACLILRVHNFFVVISSLKLQNTSFFMSCEQMTVYFHVCQELFKNVVAHHCLGAVWSHRADKKYPVQPVSVLATVDQFNAISFRVIATILKSRLIMPDERSEIVEKWIDIAQVLTNSI